LSNVTLVILCAGQSSRFKLAPKKQWLRLKDNPLWLEVSLKLSSYDDFYRTIIVAHQNELEYMKNYSDDFYYVKGGKSRQESIKNALDFVETPYVLISDVARACIPKSVINDILNSKEKADCIVPYLNVSDTVVYNGNTINRDNVKLIQTPQLSYTKTLKESILNSKESFTDESSAIKSYGGDVFYVKGSIQSSKLTFKDELNNISCLKAPSNDTFIGTGIDIHPFEDNKIMVLGGVKLPYSYGFKAHSDGDVLIHSIIDALLGAIGAGDIGEFFPDTDHKYKNVNSCELLEYIVKFVRDVGYEIVNVDTTILAQIPKINPHKNEIKKSLTTLLKIEKNKINIKATTAENLGFVGRKEAVVVQSVVSLKYYNWTEE